MFLCFFWGGGAAFVVVLLGTGGFHGSISRLCSSDRWWFGHCRSDLFARPCRMSLTAGTAPSHSAIRLPEVKRQSKMRELFSNDNVPQLPNLPPIFYAPAMTIETTQCFYRFPVADGPQELLSDQERARLEVRAVSSCFSVGVRLPKFILVVFRNPRMPDTCSCIFTY